jgi:hypothetical protein
VQNFSDKTLHVPCLALREVASDWAALKAEKRKKNPHESKYTRDLYFSAPAEAEAYNKPQSFIHEGTDNSYPTRRFVSNFIFEHFL